MDSNLGTAELAIEPKFSEGFAELKSWGEPNPRVEALAKALESVRTFENPPGADHIVERAEVFLAFLDPPA